MSSARAGSAAGTEREWGTGQRQSRQGRLPFSLSSQALSSSSPGSIYQAFSQEEAKELDIQRQGSRKAEAFLKAFLRRSIPHLTEDKLHDHLHRKAVVLEYLPPKKPKERKRKSKGFSAKQRRELRLFEIKPEEQRYNLFLPLHNLWKQYIRDLCNGLKPDTQPQMIQAKLLKADLHGAIITVTKSKCPSYVGITGILLQEMKHVFKIITKDDKLKVIPKLNCVFTVEIDGFISYIYGSKFQLRSSERSAKKFKAKGTIDL
ncbi:ribonuclease P protein subunit p29 isoform X1 [Monodelphis domestica]|uniref:ribonuclease P protein subunit p29 isoform X1 n=1 Tax=Monodelphis domestica TaxID=13616 RepID=UPI0024E26906|nr:ribonuclease P protein subunit p29 isoform X1 [Monodelphis domestica]